MPFCPTLIPELFFRREGRREEREKREREKREKKREKREVRREKLVRREK